MRVGHALRVPAAMRHGDWLLHCGSGANTMRAHLSVCESQFGLCHAGGVSLGAETFC